MRYKKTQKSNSMSSEINEQKEYLTKEIETVKKNQTEILKMKNSMNERKSKLVSLGNRVEQMEARISDIKDRSPEMTQVREKELSVKRNKRTIRAI